MIPSATLPARVRSRATLAADLHAVGLRTASEAVGRDLVCLAASVVRDLRASMMPAREREALALRVLLWEHDAAHLAARGAL